MMWLWLLLVPTIYLLILYVVARFSAKPPRTPIFFSPGELGVPQKSISFEGREGHMLRGWLLPNPSSKTLVIMVHGYLMNRSEPAAIASFLYNKGYSCMVFDFPAHGRSEGKTVGFGYLEREDVVRSVKFAREEMPSAKIVIWGSSMGAAAAAFAAAEIPVDGLVLDSSYSRLIDAMKGWWSFLGGKKLQAALAPSQMFSRCFMPFSPSKVDVAEALMNSDCPVLLMHGDADRVAPIETAKRNQSARNGIELIVFPGCDHAEGRWNEAERYRDSLIDFLTCHGLVP